MSSFKVQTPIIHTPGFKTWRISGNSLHRQLVKLDLKIPMGMLDSWYYFTDLDGWGKILWDLVFNSSLYKTDKFDCENYALKAMNECAERYDLNTMALVIGSIPQGRHGFNIFVYYDNANVRFLLWEPNEGFPFSGSAFEISEYGYEPELVLI